MKYQWNYCSLLLFYEKLQKFEEMEFFFFESCINFNINAFFYPINVAEKAYYLFWIIEIILDNCSLNKVQVNFRLSIVWYWIKNMVNVFYLDRNHQIRWYVINTV